MTSDTDGEEGVSLVPTLDGLATIGKRLALLSFVVLCLGMVVFALITPTPTAAESETAGSETVVGAMGEPFDAGVYVLDERGEATWTYERDSIAYNAVEVLETDQGQKILAAYTAKDGDDVETGVRIIDRETKTVTWEYGFEVESALNSEVHDAEVLPNGNVLMADMDRERVFIVDRENQSILWQWNASSHYTAPEDPLTRDWLHINDVDRIGDGRYLVSVRNANQLLILERGEGVVEVINEDHSDPNDENCRGLRDNQLAGDDPQCGDLDVLNHQHNPHWIDEGRVLVADSENDRVVELVRGEDGNWTVDWVRYSANGLRFDWPRDADRLPNGNTLILDTRNQRLVEISTNGSVVWATSIPPQGYAAVRHGGEAPASQTVGYGDAESQSAPPEQPSKYVAMLHGGMQHVAGSMIPAWWTEWTTLLLASSGLWIVIGLMLWGTAEVASALQGRRRRRSDRERVEDAD